MTSKCGNLRIEGLASLTWPSSSLQLKTCTVQCAGQSFLNYEARLFDRKTFLHSSSFISNDSDNDDDKAAASAAAAKKTKKKQQRDLLQISALELSKLTHYEVLGGIPMHSTYEQIKRAYHKSCLKYHPDKTGRGEEDEVFLKVKAAFDTLSDVNKRKSYDSTVDFDDAIPKGGESEGSFYKVYGPVFERNLRFAACNDPANMTTTVSQSDASGGGGKKKGRNKSVSSSAKNNAAVIPEFGDDNTPIEQVHAFYDFWIHFDSWRDFTLKATEETEHDVDAAEGRDEKRWMAKEIDRKAKAMKREEMSRITKLVERAMAADPRLKRERIREKIEKERAIQERKEKAARIQKEKEEKEAKAKKEREERLQKEREQKAKDKVEREKEKKALRKAKQSLRKSVMSAYQEQSSDDIWENMEDMNDDIELLCSELSLLEITSLNDSLNTTNNKDKPSLHLVHESVNKTRQKLKQSTIEHNRKRKEAREKAARKEALAAKSKAMRPWTREELSALAKGVKKYPPGGSNRWDSIATFVNGLCHKGEKGVLDEKMMRSREDCIEAYNNAASQGPSSGSGSKSSDDGSGGGGKIPAKKSSKGKAAATSIEEKKTEETASSDPTVWTEEQDKQLQEGLAKYPASMDKNERWTLIAKNVNGKGKKDCVLRFKAIRSALKKK